MTLLERRNLNDIYAPIETELKGFSACLKKELASNDALIQSIHTHILKMSGKFLRPALAIFSSHAEGAYTEKVIRLSVAIELIHTATLVHDDIIDDSELRRNQPAVHTKWGREISIVAGDYLYAKAFMLLADFQDPWISQAFSRCAHIMCEGEMKQIEKRNDFLMSEEQYLRIIHQKTASLFQAACMGGSYLAGASHKTVEELGDYGFNLGMAFQIVDDCLDLVGHTQELGKTAGLDLLKNDVTLPILYLFQSLGKVRGEALLAKLKSNAPNMLGEVKALATETKSVDQAMRKAKTYGDEAFKKLDGLKNSVYKDHLISLTHHCMDRIR